MRDNHGRIAYSAHDMAVIMIRSTKATTSNRNSFYARKIASSSNCRIAVLMAEVAALHAQSRGLRVTYTLVVGWLQLLCLYSDKAVFMERRKFPPIDRTMAARGK